jgi:dTDP-4-dehydrorhamnose reductase
MTNVDGCEMDRSGAWSINVDFVDCVSKIAKELNSKLIHISTDYIFDGEDGPYFEFDEPNPISWYGYTKSIGETKTEIDGLNCCILRTNVVYGNSTNGKSDFVKWVINELRSGNKIKIVSDQYSNPTISDDIAVSIYKVIKLDKKGIYNIGGSEYCDRYSFAKKISNEFELDETLIEPISTDRLNQPAKRPLRCGLTISKASNELGINFLNIKDGLNLLKNKYGY